MALEHERYSDCTPFHPLLATYAASRYLQQEDPTMAAQYDRQFQVELDNLSRRFADTLLHNR